MSEEATELPFPDRRQHRKLFRFDPTVSMGSIGTLVTLLAMFITAWGAYQRDSERKDNRIAVLERVQDEEKAANKEAMKELRAKVEKVQETVTSVDKNVAEVRASLAIRGSR